MGSGKTVIGKKLAKALDYRFVDLDQEIEKATGVTVTTIFEMEGETGFRAREAGMLAAMTKLPEDQNGLVVATGGGAVLDPINRTRLAANGTVIYLQASPGLIMERTRHDRARPLLQVRDRLDKIRSLVEWRDPLYREVADRVVESGAGTGNMVAKIVADLSNG